MAWIESHQAIKDHPKRADLSARMGWDVDTTVGKLHRFWWWCVDYAENGDLRKFNDGILGEAVGLNGDAAKKFVEAMVTARWLDRKPYFRVHDWWDYIGLFLQGKYKHYPDKWQSVRALYVWKATRSKNISKNGSKNETPTDLNQPTQTDLPTDQPERVADWSIPESLNFEGFRESWLKWVKHRGEIHKKLTPTQADSQLKQFAKWGVDRAITAIDHTVTMGWQGIREPDQPRKDQRGNGHHQPKPTAADKGQYAEERIKLRVLNAPDASGSRDVAPRKGGGDKGETAAAR